MGYVEDGTTGCNRAVLELRQLPELVVTGDGAEQTVALDDISRGKPAQ